MSGLQLLAVALFVVGCAVILVACMVDIWEAVAR